MRQTFRPWLPIFQALKSVSRDKASRECFPADPLELMGSAGGVQGSDGACGKKDGDNPCSGRTEGAERVQSIVAAMVSSCSTILLHPSSLHSRQRGIIVF